MTVRMTALHDHTYGLFREDPEGQRGSGLYQRYMDGKSGVRRPTDNQCAEIAAWRAGRDFAIGKGLAEREGLAGS